MVRFMKSILKKSKNNAGFAIIEVLISMGIIAVLVIGFQSLIVRTVKTSRANQAEFQANLYLRAAIETAKALEQSPDGWDKFSAATCTTDNKCGFTENGTGWDINSGTELLDNLYTRSFIIETIESDIKKFTATIEWFNGISNRSLNLETYVYQGIFQ